MASIISAGTTSGTAIAVSGDTTGDLAFTTQAGANTITVPNATGTVILANASNNLQMNSGYGSNATAYGCRAWVNFNGTGTVAIRASGNVSSVSDNGVGRYTVNFTTAMPDANYAITGMANGDGYVAINNGSAYSTTAVAVYSNDSLNIGVDRSFFSVSIFR
jgi:hypothetical protein